MYEYAYEYACGEREGGKEREQVGWKRVSFVDNTCVLLSQYVTRTMSAIEALSRLLKG